MPTVPRALRRAALVAGWAGGGLTAVVAGGYGLLRVEAVLARRAIGDPLGRVPPAPPRRVGAGSGDPLRLVVLGDSSAAGLGALRPEETPAAVVAGGLAALSGRSVELVTTAVVGAVSADLPEQAARALREVPRPDAVLVMVGANDVTHRVRPADAVRPLATAVARLRAAGAEVVVGTCPDFGSLEPLAPPLRQVAQRLSRELAAAQTVAVVEVGGRTVSLGGLLGPAFHDHPSEMFAADGFHPSPAGYARVAAVLLPTLAAALGLWSGTVDVLPDPSGAGRRADGRSVEGRSVEGRSADGPGGRGPGDGEHGEDGRGEDGRGEDGRDGARSGRHLERRDPGADGPRRSGRWEGLLDLPPWRTGHRAVPLAEAAETAAATPGTEVSPADAEPLGPERREAGPEGPGSEGAGPEGRGSEGAGPEGSAPEGSGSEESGSEGSGPRGRRVLGVLRRRTGPLETGPAAAGAAVEPHRPGPGGTG